MTKDEALKLALEALEEAADAIDSWGSYASGYFQVKHDLEGDISKAKSAITAIREALAQPEQEPVAWVGSLKDPQPHCVTNLMYCSAAQWDTGYHLKYIPLYTSPPAQRTWVGLTDEELETINDCGDTDSYKFARAIEAKLKEKNT